VVVVRQPPDPVSSLARCELKTSPGGVAVKPPETAVAIAKFATKR
jgi:hypothetical protein